MSTSLLVTAQHSEPYRKICRMHVLYNFSLAGMVILDLQMLCYVNCNIKIITHRDKFYTLAIRKRHFKHFIIKSKKLM